MINQKLQIFLGLIDENNHISLDDYKGSFLIIYFYPKDKTSGCTVESQDFRDYKDKFARKIVKLLGYQEIQSNHI